MLLRRHTVTGRGYARLARTALDALTANEGVPLATTAAFPSPDSPGVATIISDASGDIAGGDAGCGGFVLHPLAPGLAFTMSEPWPADLAAAIRESALEPRHRSGAPRLSMPAAELFTSWACLEAALDAGSLRPHTLAAIAVGDCQPAAAALNRASSGAPVMRDTLAAARASIPQWLGVQVPRELNATADLLSHPSRRGEALAALAELGVTPVLAPLPPSHRCWTALRDAVLAADPADDDS